MLSQHYNLDKVTDIFENNKINLSFPSIENRECWNGIDYFVKNNWIESAKQYLGFKIAPLTAELFMEFYQNGNRLNYEQVCFERRKALSTLVLAECVENRGHFLKDIINIILAICEETTWIIPAHHHMSVGETPYISKENQQSFPNSENEFLDIFACETGALLAWTYYLLRSSLDKISKLVCKRIEREIFKRIILPIKEYDDFWWSGLCDSNALINNWNPWCCSNLISVVLIFLPEKDKKLFCGLVYKLLRIVDNFIDSYQVDGGCDEGPGYWFRAGGSLFDFLEQLYSASNGKIDIFDNTKIKNMALYIYKMNISDNYYVNFADSNSKCDYNGVREFLFAKRIKNKEFIDNSVYHFKKSNNKLFKDGKTVYHKLLATFSYNEINAYPCNENYYFKDVWFSDIQVMCARENQSNKGLFVAVKGGHNDENHNHNDVGNFIIYIDGEPVVCDIGVGVYTKKSFSDRRYEIDMMKSSFHNLPVINHCEQKNGSQYKAENVSYIKTEDKTQFQCELAKAYDNSANISSYQRRVALNRLKKEVIIEDVIKFLQKENSLYYPLILAQKPVELEKNCILLNDKYALYLVGEGFSCEILEYKLNDEKLEATWGKSLYILKLFFNHADYVAKLQMIFREEVQKC